MTKSFNLHKVCLPRCLVWCLLTSSSKSSSWSSRNKTWLLMIRLDTAQDLPPDSWGPHKIRVLAQTQRQPLQDKELCCSFRSSPPSGYQPLWPPLCSSLPVSSLRPSLVVDCQRLLKRAALPRQPCPKPRCRRRSESFPEASFKPHCCI